MPEFHTRVYARKKKTPAHSWSRCRKIRFAQSGDSTAAFGSLALSYGALRSSSGLLPGYSATLGSCWLTLSCNIAAVASLCPTTNSNTAIYCSLSGGCHGRTRHVGRNRRAGCTNSGGQSLALVIGAVIATLLVGKILTVCGIHLINTGDRIREVMILHRSAALAGYQQAYHHSNQAKYKLTSAGHRKFQGQI